MTPRVTVLGASGYLGAAVSAALARGPGALRLVGRNFDGHPVAASGRHDVRCADLRRPGAVADAVEGSDVIVHLVADLGPVGAWRASPGRQVADGVDVAVLHEIVEAGRRRARSGPPVGLVHASSVVLNVRTAAPTAYERQKALGEELVLSATTDGSVRGTCLRVPALCGPPAHGGRPDRGVVRLLAEQALAGGPVTVWGSGANLRSLLQVEDAAEAFAVAVRRIDRLAGRSWDVGMPSGTTLRELARLVVACVASVTGRPPAPLLSVPPPGDATSYDLGDAVCDPGPFTEATGWRPTRSLHDAVHDTITAMVLARRESVTTS